jgi:hypothetical protein
VPVPLSLNVDTSGLAYPFGSPKVLFIPLLIWDPDGAASVPMMLEIFGLEVVFRQNVEEEGLVSGLCFEMCLVGFGGT